MSLPSASAIVEDYRLGMRSRAFSVIGRREVLSGKAKFGIFGDGKEVAQLAMARSTRAGDWRAGYYRDQTVALATGLTTLPELFAQLYADTEPGHDPSSGGRNMNNHFASRLLDDDGQWRDQLGAVNSSAGFAAVAVHIATALGLAYASKLYRDEPELARHSAGFSANGSEVVFASIGNASAAEGIFFETINAAAVLQVPLLTSVWDDGYGISVPNHLQMAMNSVSRALAGLNPKDGEKGLSIRSEVGWDYAALCAAYEDLATQARTTHGPALLHVTELTQPLGHSSSGSHERYKDAERLAWEKEFDCLARMRLWIMEQDILGPDQLAAIDSEEKALVESERDLAWARYRAGIEAERKLVTAAIDEARLAGALTEELRSGFDGEADTRRSAQSLIESAALQVRDHPSPAAQKLSALAASLRASGLSRYRSHLYSQSRQSPLEVAGEVPVYSDTPEVVDGRTLLLRFFDARFAADPRLFVIGEDVGQLGDVNLVFEGLQAKFGANRVTDTGIREATILGQGIGAALRGLRPIVDIQYLDYFLFALEVASDDLATLHYRTAGGQKAPVIIRTKGHRLVGMTHAGSPMGVIVHACRGIYVCVPRDMTRAAGLYATLIEGDNPGLVVEVLNGYRLKEALPSNLSSLRIPLGRPETLRSGSHVTVVTYGALCRIAMEAAVTLSGIGIEVEVIDVQTLNPFDLQHSISRSVAKTAALVVLDEDVPGGASAYILQQVLETQEAFQYLDAAPVTITAAPNRPSYGADGDYFTKPGHDEIVRAVYRVMSERSPAQYPALG